MNFDLSDLSIAAHAYGAFLLLGFGGASMVFVHACLKRDTCSLFKSLKVYSGRRRPLLIAAFLLCGAFMGLVAGLCADPPAKVLLLPLAGGA
jgi:hypothetical protein